MVVVLVFVVVVLVLMVAVLVFHEWQCRLGVRSLDHDTGDVIAQGLERAVQPGQQTEAVDHHDIGLGDREQVARCEFELVGLDAGAHDCLDFHAVAADALGEVLHRVNARDHAQRLGRNDRRVRGRGAGGRARGLGGVRAGGDRHRQGQARGDERHAQFHEVQSRHVTLRNYPSGFGARRACVPVRNRGNRVSDGAYDRQRPAVLMVRYGSGEPSILSIHCINNVQDDTALPVLPVQRNGPGPGSGPLLARTGKHEGSTSTAPRPRSSMRSAMFARRCGDSFWSGPQSACTWTPRTSMSSAPSPLSRQAAQRW